MKPNFVHRARRWLAWRRDSDRVRYWRGRAEQEANGAKTDRRLRDIAETDHEQAVTELTAAVLAAVQLGNQLEATRADLAKAERRVRALEVDLESEQRTVTDQAQLIEQLNEQLGVRGHLAGLTPAARRAAMEAVDPTNEWGWRE